MNNSERLNLHEIACTLFPHIRDREELKKKLKLLEAHNYNYDPYRHCYTNLRLGSISSEILLDSIEMLDEAIRFQGRCR